MSQTNGKRIKGKEHNQVPIIPFGLIAHLCNSQIMRGVPPIQDF